MLGETRKLVAVGLLVFLSVSTVSAAPPGGEANVQDKQKTAADSEESAGPNLSGEQNEETKDAGNKGSEDEFGDDEEIVLETVAVKDSSPVRAAGEATTAAATKPETAKPDTGSLNGSSSSSSMASGSGLSESSGLPLQSTTVTQKSTNSNKEINTEAIPKAPVNELVKNDAAVDTVKVTNIVKPAEKDSEPVASPLVNENIANENPNKEDTVVKDSKIDGEAGKPAVKEQENKEEQEEKTNILPEEPAKPPSDTVGDLLPDEDKVPEAQKGVEDMREVTYKKNISPGGGEELSQSNFLGYFIVLSIITIIGYLVFHNKKKILGLIVEGRGARQAGRRRSGGREYRKLDSNMEDMLESGKETSMRQVIY